MPRDRTTLYRAQLLAYITCGFAVQHTAQQAIPQVYTNSYTN